MSSNGFEEAIRKALDLNLRFYSSLGRLTVDYWRELFSTITGPTNSSADSTHAVASPAQVGMPAPAGAAPSKVPVAMVLEAEPGSVALGVFLVENHHDAPVDSAVVASFFKNPAGVAVQPTLTFDPPRVVLKPGEQILVRVSTTIGTELEPDTRYAGEFAVPGLKGTSIPVILRSRKKQ
jgi:hypothetical protein